MEAADGPVTIPVFSSKDDIRTFSRQHKREGKKVAFVPTMVHQPSSSDRP